MSEKVMLKSFGMQFEANLIVSLLDNAGIPNWTLNKQDSSYNTFGNIELYVDRENLENAVALINAEQE